MNTLQRQEVDFNEHFRKIAGILADERFPPGERAALRRMSPGLPLPLAFYRFAYDYFPKMWEHQASDWVCLTAGIALMSPYAFRLDVSFGRALAEAGYSEIRLERLLAADNAVRRILLLRAARFLAAKTCPFNWADAAGLLLVADDNLRRRKTIAIDYFKHKKDEV